MDNDPVWIPFRDSIDGFLYGFKLAIAIDVNYDWSIGVNFFCQ